MATKKEKDYWSIWVGINTETAEFYTSTIFSEVVEGEPVTGVVEIRVKKRQQKTWTEDDAFVVEVEEDV